MSRRALTLIELLAALALFAALTAAIASLTTVTLAAAADAGGRLGWQSAASATLRSIADDLAIADLQPRSSSPRAAVHDCELTIQTRGRVSAQAAGPIDATYRHDAASRTLSRTTRSRAGSTAVELLLDDVHIWSAAIDETGATLDVSITAVNGSRLERRFRLP